MTPSGKTHLYIHNAVPQIDFDIPTNCNALITVHILAQIHIVKKKKNTSRWMKKRRDLNIRLYFHYTASEVSQVCVLPTGFLLLSTRTLLLTVFTYKDHYLPVNITYHSSYLHKTLNVHLPITVMDSVTS